MDDVPVAPAAAAADATGGNEGGSTALAWGWAEVLWRRGLHHTNMQVGGRRAQRTVPMGSHIDPPHPPVPLPLLPPPSNS